MNVQRTEDAEQAIARARAEERERCAKVCEEYSTEVWRADGDELANRIRAMAGEGEPSAARIVEVPDADECPLSYVPEMGHELLCQHPLNLREPCPYEAQLSWPCKFLRERSVLVVLGDGGGDDER